MKAKAIEVSCANLRQIAPETKTQENWLKSSVRLHFISARQTREVDGAATEAGQLETRSR